MNTVGLLVCGAFSDEIMKKYDGVYEDFFIDGLLAADSSLNFVSYAVYKGIFPASVHECDSWLITGSKNGVYENLPWMLRLQDFIKEVYDTGIPQVGICFGHQIMAQALGGQVEKSDSGWGLGYQEYEMLEEFSGFSDVLKLHAIHQDQIVAVPEDARVIARTDHCPNAALIYKGTAFSMQPHPEFSREFEIDLISSILGDSVPEALGRKAIKGLEGTKVDNQEVMKMMARFLKGQR